MPADTRLLRADTGQEVTLGELVLSQEQPMVWTLDEQTYRLVPRRLIRTFPSGVRPVFRLRLASGLEVNATANHPFRTVAGWKRLDELQLGDSLAVPRSIPAPSNPQKDSLRLLDTQKPNPHLDLIPHSVATDVRQTLATSEVSWDVIVEITPLGEQPTFDATVEGTHNFIANGIIAHNSLEQDADVVLFLYRDELYNPESADRGSAEVIVAKHRNGPTGKLQLAFLDHYTRFANMARV
jgi:replicative DNA helicase